VVSVICQSLLIFALCLFLTAFDLDSKCIVLALGVSLFSGFVFVNSFYVWPKLLAAAYILAGSALLLAPRFSLDLSHTIVVPVLTGALACFGVLAHGASAFALLGLILTMVALKRRISLKSLLLLAVTLFSLYLPWTLYQKLYDPPGDRLLKFHLAGIEEVDPRSVIQALTSAYSGLTFRQFLRNKLKNLTPILGHEDRYWRSMWNLAVELASGDSRTTPRVAQTAAKIRHLCFFYFVPALGFLVLGPIALLVGLLKRYRSTAWRLAAITWLYVCLTAAVWCLLMFTPGMTVIHTSSYAIILLAFAGSISALWAVSPSIALLIGSIQIATNFALYVWLITGPVADAVLPHGSVRYATLGLALLSLASVLSILGNLAQRRPTAANIS